MKPVFISETNLPKMANTHGKEAHFADTKLRGYGVRVSASGAKSFVLRYSSPLDGRQRRFKIGDSKTMSATRARALAQEALADLRNGIDPQEAKITLASTWTCAELFDRYLTNLEFLVSQDAMSPATLRERRSYIERRGGFRAHFAAFKVTDIIREMVEQAVRSPLVAGTPVSAVTHNRRLVVAQQLFKFAVEHGQLEYSPTDGIKRLRESPARRRLTAEQMTRVLAELTAMEAEHSAAQIELLRFLIATAARAGESKSLKWDDVDWDEKVARPNQFKGRTRGRTREIRLNAPALSALKRMWGIRQCAYVFPTRVAGGGAWTFTKTVSKTWEKAQRRAGIDPVSVHDIRSTGISELVDAGVSPTAIAAHVGHANAKQVMSVYARPDEEKTREAAARLVY